MINDGKLNSTNVNETIHNQRLLEVPVPLLDLTNYDLITLGALVPLTALCIDLSNKGRPLTIKVGNPNLRDRFIKSGFYAAAENKVNFDPPIPLPRLADFDEYRGSNSRLIEITKIGSYEDLDPVLHKATNTLRFSMQYEKRDALNIGIALSEMCQNTFDHNEGISGFFSLQLCGNRPNRFTEIGISDCGVGLARTLTENVKNPRSLADKEAIRLAIKLGASQYDDPTRGTGFYHLIRMVEKYKGSIRITSGTATYYYRADKNSDYYFTSAPMPGVTVILSLPQN